MRGPGFYIYTRIKISVFMDISVLGFYGYIEDILEIYRYL